MIIGYPRNATIALQLRALVLRIFVLVHFRDYYNQHDLHFWYILAIR